MDRSPPPSKPPGADDAARGTLRDALGALGNLAQLAGSARVGSKAIEPVLPDVLASAGPMREATRELLSALRPKVGDSPVADELAEHLLSRIDELESELEAIVSGPLRTPGRLDLDRLLGRLSSELDAAQSLLDLLETAGAEPLVPLRVPEVLRQRLPAPPSGKRPRRRLAIRLSADQTLPEVPLKARALAQLVGTLAELAGADAAPPSVRVVAEADAILVEVAPGATDAGAEVEFWGYGVIGPTPAAVSAAARLSGLGLELGPARSRLLVPLPV